MFRKVFPAGAGVFPSKTRHGFAGDSVPRRCGGVPLDGEALLVPILCSPQVRGCSFVGLCSFQSPLVFPAGAGVFLTRPRGPHHTPCVPRRCGGVPSCSPVTASSMACSPQVRGCSNAPAPGASSNAVFPAGAGVFPLASIGIKRTPRVPRRCGGVPFY